MEQIELETFRSPAVTTRSNIYKLLFSGLPSDWLKDDFEMPETPPCIISTLCQIKDGLLVDAAATKEYNWKPVLKTFFEKAVSVCLICSKFL